MELGRQKETLFLLNVKKWPVSYICTFTFYGFY